MGTLGLLRSSGTTEALSGALESHPSHEYHIRTIDNRTEPNTINEKLRPLGPQRREQDGVRIARATHRQYAVTGLRPAPTRL